MAASLRPTRGGCFSMAKLPQRRHHCPDAPPASLGARCPLVNRGELVLERSRYAKRARPEFVIDLFSKMMGALGASDVLGTPG
jgi:hypothetical protein